MPTDVMPDRRHSGRMIPRSSSASRTRKHRTMSPLARLHRPVLIALVIGILTNQLSMTIGGLTLSFERAIGLSLLPVLGYVLLFRAVTPRARRVVWIWFGWCIVLFASAIATGQFGLHAVGLITAALPIAVLAFFLVRPLDMADTGKILNVSLWIISAIGAVETLLKYIIGHGLFERFLFGIDGRLTLLTFEANVLASSTAVLILATLPRSRMNWSSIMLYTCALITMFGAGSKMPLISLISGVLIYGVVRSVALDKSVSISLILPVWIIGAVLVVLLPTSDKVQAIYDSTIARPDAIAGRLYVNAIAIERFRESPLIGRGPGDFALSDRSTLRKLGTDDPRNLWISQMILNILHDSGTVGMLFYIMFIITLLNRGFSFIRAGSIDHCGYLAAFISLVISSQATTVHLNVIFGLVAGLLGATPVTIWRDRKAERKGIVRSS